ncbi:MAG: hypothetical protein HYV63_33170 [Candidatus Schekmanbacteria bacterium]|nr:hypothetical protein [Candidatus Schekmanbacteria bacterium]
MRKEWTDQDAEFIQEHYATMTTKEMADKLERSEQAIRSKIRRMGLERKARGGNRKPGEGAPGRTAGGSESQGTEALAAFGSWGSSSAQSLPDLSAPERSSKRLDLGAMRMERARPIGVDPEGPVAMHHNVTCRVCRITDGYIVSETNCRHCGAVLYRMA